MQVKSTKMNRTIVVRRDYLHFIKKYQRYEKRHTNISAHLSPCFRCHEGDTVVIGQCRCARGRSCVVRVCVCGGAEGGWREEAWSASGPQLAAPAARHMRPDACPAPRARRPRAGRCPRRCASTCCA